MRVLAHRTADLAHIADTQTRAEDAPITRVGNGVRASPRCLLETSRNGLDARTTRPNILASSTIHRTRSTALRYRRGCCGAIVVGGPSLLLPGAAAGSRRRTSSSLV